MSILDNIVNVKLVKPTGVLKGFDFGTLLIIGDSAQKTRVKRYSDIYEVVKDYKENTPEFKVAILEFGQRTKIDSILIGKVFKDESHIDGLKLIVKENSNFYAPMITSKKADYQSAIADFMETDRRILGVLIRAGQMANNALTSIKKIAFTIATFIKDAIRFVLIDKIIDVLKWFF